MPRLSVYYLRASLIYLLLGFALGGLLLANKGFMLSSAIWMLLPLHIEFDLMGWLVQLILGAAFWILPRFSKEPPRGNESLSWTAFFLLSIGILLVAIDGITDIQWLIVMGRAMEMLAWILFAFGNWRRIKAHGVGYVIWSEPHVKRWGQPALQGRVLWQRRRTS